MRLVALLTHSTTLLLFQQAVIIWFMLDFFLARESSTANKLYNENIVRSESGFAVIENIETIVRKLETSLTCDDLLYKTPTFDKVILTVVDALGSEFIEPIRNESDRHNGKKESSRMPFVEESLALGRTMGFVAKAATPTVTMPRIKALVSGTIPSFMDVVYNLASDVSDFHEDNLLKSAKSNGKQIVFYGDDTWISLFGKSIFLRSRETLSLYASDYTSVDTNVTEMALPETARDPIDWDLLILHYLGLDHIGHIFGTNQSPLIDNKLAEMDSVIQKMYNNMAAKDLKTLMIVCGDHGMSREGNHGGDSALESETAMLFTPINGKFASSRHDNGIQISQVDLAITIALLTGLPIPSMSRGVIIEPLLRNIWHHSTRHITCASIYNLKQLSLLLQDEEFKEPYGLGTRVLKLFERMATNTSAENEQSFIRQSLSTSRTIQDKLLEVVVSKSNGYKVLIVVVLVMLLSIINMRRACNRLLVPLMNHSEKLACLCAVTVPIIMLNSTNFIEVEQAFWPIYSMATFSIFCLVAIRKHSLRPIVQDIDWLRVVLFVITFLISFTWNNISFLGHHDWGWSLPLISIIIMCNFTRQTSRIGNKHGFLFFAVGLLIFANKIFEETSGNNHAVASLQLLMLLVLALASLGNTYISYVKDDAQATSIVQKLATSWMWWVFLLSRSRNYAFIISNVVMEASLNNLSNSFQFNPVVRAIMYLQFANNAFYGQGNTNLFTSLDIKPAFYGQVRYNIFLAVPLLACSTFGSQIYWYLKLFQRVQGEKEQERMSMRSRLLDVTNTSKLIPEGTKDAIKDLIDMRNFLTIAYYILVCMVLRDHLFIWSVLSPKLVYLFMMTITIRLTTAFISNLPCLLSRIFVKEAHYDKIVD